MPNQPSPDIGILQRINQPEAGKSALRFDTLYCITLNGNERIYLARKDVTRTLANRNEAGNMIKKIGIGILVVLGAFVVLFIVRQAPINPDAYKPPKKPELTGALPLDLLKRAFKTSSV